MSIKHDVSRRQFLRGGAALGAAAFFPMALAGCGSDDEPTKTGGKTTAKPLALKVGYLAAPWFGLYGVGRDRGWFKEDGVDLQLTLLEGGPPLLEAMSGGSIDTGMLGTIPPLIAASQGVFPLRIISVVGDASPLYSIIADGSINSVADLRGKKVAAALGTNFQFLLDLALKKHGMTEDDIELVNAQPVDAQAAFIGRRVDALLPAAADRALIEEKRPDSKVIFVPDDLTKDPNPQPAVRLYDLLVAPEEQVTEHKDAMTRMLQTFHGRISPWAADSATRGEAAAAILEWQNETLKASSNLETLTSQISDYIFYDVPGQKDAMAGADLKESLKSQADFLLRTGAIKSIPDISAMIDTSIVDGLRA